MSKKKAKKLIEVLKKEKIENHPGKIDTVWLTEEEVKFLNDTRECRFYEFKVFGLELLKGGIVRMTDGGDFMADITKIFSPSTLDLLAEKLAIRLLKVSEKEQLEEKWGIYKCRPGNMPEDILILNWLRRRGNGTRSNCHCLKRGRSLISREDFLIKYNEGDKWERATRFYRPGKNLYSWGGLHPLYWKLK